MLTKICGITRLEDAEYAVECGADALGFVFWPGSPRVIDADRARAIVAALPATVSFGVFVNQPPDEINRIAALVRLAAIQLHGEESVADARRLERPAVKAIALAAAADDAIGAWPESMLLLLDAHDTERRGGTGRTIEWPRAAAISRRRRVLLAGGLRPDNVIEAIGCVRPFGIDVSSGVEERPGVKDRGRLRALFEAIREADRPAVSASRGDGALLEAWGLAPPPEVR